MNGLFPWAFRQPFAASRHSRSPASDPAIDSALELFTAMEMSLLVAFGPCIGAELYAACAKDVTALFAAPRDPSWLID